MLGWLTLSQSSLRLSSFLLILFSLFLSASFISTTLSSTSLILSFASVILLLIPSRVLLISFIALFVIDRLFFISSSSAAAKSLQSCLTLCNPIDGLLPGSSVPGILQERILEWVAISFSNAWKWKVKVKLLSHVWLLATSWTAAYQAPLSMGFSRQEYWSGVPLPSPNMLSRLVITFLPKSKHLLISWLQ